MPTDERLSLVFPMWNEEELASHTVERAQHTGEALVAAATIASFEIVLVDDGSTDATPRLVDEAAAGDPRVTVVHHERNRGLGAAVRSGFDAATGSLVLYTDSDLPVDLDQVSTLIDLLRSDGADLLSAYRLNRGDRRRGAYSAVYNLLVRIVLGLHVRDVNFACKLVTRRVLDAMQLRSEGSFIDAELLARASRLGFVIIQTPLEYFPRTRGTSTLSSARTIRGILAEMARYTPQIRRLRPRAPH